MSQFMTAWMNPEQGFSFLSLRFLVFFMVLLALCLRLDHRLQNRVLLGASYFFYAFWGPGYALLLAAVTVFQYFCAGRIYRSQDPRLRKRYLFWSVAGGIGTLAVFKYVNFVVYGVLSLLGGAGVPVTPFWLGVLLPAGLSFYTFQTLSYTIDIYWRRAVPADRFEDFALYVAFFPQLLAGPIERARSFLPQILKSRSVTAQDLREGAFLFFLGAYQKYFIADNLAKHVGPFFESSGPYRGAEVLLMTYAFAFQLYGDFAGYSNMARGLGRCLGFDLMVNFNTPYLSRNPVEFWRRWHISLYSWIRDYVYVPLIYSPGKKDPRSIYTGTFVVMLLGALWHGVGLNYIFWGTFAALQIILYVLWRQRYPASEKFKAGLSGTFIHVFKVLAFFHLSVCMGWLIARTSGPVQFMQMLKALLFRFAWLSSDSIFAGQILFCTWLLILFEAAQYRWRNFWVLQKGPWQLRWAVYSVMAVSLLLLGDRSGRVFIYFQF